MAKRKNLPSIKNHDPLVPIDVTDLGNENDCFGQAYDLTTKECKLCGDAELCAIKMAQTLKVTRKKLEEENHYKDLDTLEDVKGIKKFIRAQKRKGITRREIVKKASIKFEVPTKDIRKIYKSIENIFTPASN